MSGITVDDGERPFAGRRVAFVGKLGGVTKRDAKKLVRQCGGEPVDETAPRA